MLELETISQIDEEKRREEKMKEFDDKKRKERELKAQEEAWRTIQEKRNKFSPSIAVVSPTIVPSKDPSTLVDLDFDDPMLISTPEGQPHKKLPPIPTKRTDPRGPTKTPTKSEQLFAKLIEMGLSADIIKLGFELIGPDNESKLVNFVTDFQKLEEQPEKFSRTQIQQALLLYDLNYNKSLPYLQSCKKLTKLGITEDQLLEALSTFNNDITLATQFLTSYGNLKELGFSDLKIREALVMCNNDYQKAVQYLLENP